MKKCQEPNAIRRFYWQEFQRMISYTITKCSSSSRTKRSAYQFFHSQLHQGMHLPFSLCFCPAALLIQITKKKLGVESLPSFFEKLGLLFLSLSYGHISISLQDSIPPKAQIFSEHPSVKTLIEPFFHKGLTNPINLQLLVLSITNSVTIICDRSLSQVDNR